ncbi:hypothetical protein [Pseudomonas putida]|uniref:hypothetical protein n=1 Tax=Pseudomonas putida TaxID=303 RepID=UPI000B142647|nr:hypothetical protein [Pseudomonas putida]
MSHKSKSMFLETVIAPFRNSLIPTMTDRRNPHFERVISRSKLYMIGGRPRADFVNHSVDENSETMRVDVAIGGIIVDSGIINLGTNIPGETLGVSWDRDIIYVGQHLEQGQFRAKRFFTPDSVYWHRSRESQLVSGFNRYQSVCNYDLLYIGIANSSGSFDRLIKKAHHGRQQILTEENIRYLDLGNRVSDEIILFTFDIEPLIIQSWGDLSDDPNMDEIISNFDLERSVADAEKAFVSMLKPQYNKVMYEQYPKGADGLYRAGFDIYQYFLNENIILNTPSGSFAGKRDVEGFGFEGDAITVRGDNVRIYKANDGQLP